MASARRRDVPGEHRREWYDGFATGVIVGGFALSIGIVIFVIWTTR